MRKDTVNIYDIANMAGVSIATVSRVMNGSEKVSENTRKKVMDVINEVGFTPNVFAQGLGLNTMHTVGILVPTISDNYMSSAVACLESALSEHKYDCLLGCSGFGLEDKRIQTEMLLSKHIDALILVGSTYAGTGSDPKETEYIREAAKQVPVFVINGSVIGDNVYSAVCDDEAAIYQATTLLLERGYRNVIFLTDSHSYSAIKKKTGYERAMEDKGLSSRHAHVENRIHAVRDYLRDHSEIEFDAVVACNDEIAVGVVKYAIEKELCIPDDFAVVGYNNSVLAVACEPEISSIDNHTEQICRDTVDRLISILTKESNTVQRKTSVPCELIERGTT